MSEVEPVEDAAERRPEVNERLSVDVNGDSYTTYNGHLSRQWPQNRTGEGEIGEVNCHY